MNPSMIPIRPIDLNTVASLGIERYRQAGPAKEISNEQAKQVAKDFESVLLHKLLDAMKKTIPESDLFETGISEQFRDIFWFHLAQEMGKQGGLGIWKMLYRQIEQSAHSSEGTSILEIDK